jgi:hypothetical protein
MIIDFTQPVNNVKFYITGGDNFGTVGYLDYYQNGNPLKHLAIGGPGPSHIPIPIELNFNNITRVKVHDISDALGLTFDDFSFTVPAPTPTPTPPSPPSSLNGVPDENSAKLTWTASAGAVSYVVTRSGDNCSDNSSTSQPTSETANADSIVEISPAVAG